VGFWRVDQHTPLATTVPLPLAVIDPPEVAQEDVMPVTAVVVSVISKGPLPAAGEGVSSTVSQEKRTAVSSPKHSSFINVKRCISRDFVFRKGLPSPQDPQYRDSGIFPLFGSSISAPILPVIKR
jgi:hypothetical protein